MSLKFSDFKNRIKKETFSDAKIGEYCQFSDEEDSKTNINTKSDDNISTWITIIIIFSLANAIVLCLIAYLIFKIKKNKESLDIPEKA